MELEGAKPHEKQWRKSRIVIMKIFSRHDLVRHALFMNFNFFVIVSDLGHNSGTASYFWQDMHRHDRLDLVLDLIVETRTGKLHRHGQGQSRNAVVEDHCVHFMISSPSPHDRALSLSWALHTRLQMNLRKVLPTVTAKEQMPKASEAPPPHVPWSGFDVIFL